MPLRSAFTSSSNSPAAMPWPAGPTTFAASNVPGQLAFPERARLGSAGAVVEIRAEATPRPHRSCGGRRGGCVPVSRPPGGRCTRASSGSRFRRSRSWPEATHVASVEIAGTSRAPRSSAFRFRLRLPLSSSLTAGAPANDAIAAVATAAVRSFIRDIPPPPNFERGLQRRCMARAGSSAHALAGRSRSSARRASRCPFGTRKSQRNASAMTVPGTSDWLAYRDLPWAVRSVAGASSGAPRATHRQDGASVFFTLGLDRRSSRRHVFNALAPYGQGHKTCLMLFHARVLSRRPSVWGV